MIHNVIFFFFSSRRRHTRWPRDWSSDVCSSDLPPPGGEETSQTLSAPDPPEAGPRVEVGAQDRPPGTTDGRPLAQQVYDQRNPLSEYDLPTILLNQNVPPDQVDDTIRAIIHNEPPPGQPHPRFGL